MPVRYVMDIIVCTCDVHMYMCMYMYMHIYQPFPAPVTSILFPLKSYSLPHSMIQPRLQLACMQVAPKTIATPTKNYAGNSTPKWHSYTYREVVLHTGFMAKKGLTRLPLTHGLVTALPWGSMWETLPVFWHMGGSMTSSQRVQWR